MVKIQPNLAEVRRRLKLSCTLEVLGSACNVLAQPNINLMIIRVTWGSAEEMTAIANTLRDVFLETQQRIDKATAAEQIRDLEQHLDVVFRRLKAADMTLQEFTAAHKGIHFDQGAEGDLDQPSERVPIENEAVRVQGPNLDQVMKDLRQRALDGRASSDKLESVIEMNARVLTLLNAIQEDRAYRANLAELAQREKELELAKKLKAKGFIPEDAYQKALAAYEKQKALTVDTEQIKALKGEVTNLLEKREQRLEEAKAQLNALPQLKLQYVVFRREVLFWEAEKRDLEGRLAQARRDYESDLSEFSVVSDAAVPTMPTKSNRRLLAAGVAAVGSMLGFVFILALELTDTTIKSGAELSLKLSLPVLGVLSRLSSDQPIFPGKTESALIEPFKIIAQQLRRVVPKRGARILIVSARHGEGSTLVATNLAGCFGRQEERVLLVDAQLRSGGGQRAIRDLILDDGDSLKGLGAYLSFKTDGVQDVVWPTVLTGVKCIPHVGETVSPDQVCSSRMRKLLEEASERFGLVLVDAPPVLPYADAEVMAPWMDGIVFVVKSQACRLSALKKALDRLKGSGAPIIGTILNGVDPLYLE